MNHSIVSDLDKNGLLNLMIEKDKRIQDLERLVEDQRRLRLQDSNQVEEKAAKIKEWVTNKLKELENQNKRLRDQNKKQKEVVVSLSNKLASLSPISSPRRKGSASQLDNVQYIDQNSPEQPMLNQSLKSSRPQIAKKNLQTLNRANENEDLNLRIKLNSSTHAFMSPKHMANANSGISYVSIQDQNSVGKSRESPLYDSVSIEMISDLKRKPQVQNLHRLDDHKSSVNNVNSSSLEQLNLEPPPRPMHQSDKWEAQLYSLADEAFSSMLQTHDDDQSNVQCYDGRLDTPSRFRKSLANFKDEIISLAKPSFTTIDGDQVVDDAVNESVRTSSHNSAGQQTILRPALHKQHSLLSVAPETRHSEEIYTVDNTDMKQLTHNLFDSPMRVRNGKDSILRTQSVRKNPTPARLYDYVSADLVKRNYLIKHGALRSHNRWFVLKNFHFYSYKREDEETSKTAPTMTLKLEPSVQIHSPIQSNEGFAFKITHLDKTMVLVADSVQLRDEWVKILTVAINLSDIEPEKLTKQGSIHEGFLSVTRNGLSKRCHAILVSHLLFFLKSPIDPTPMGYVSVRSSKIREITDNYDYDIEEQERMKITQDCSLAIYPKHSLNLDPVYLTFNSQHDTDGWLFHLSAASGVDQSCGTEFEHTLTHLMISSLMKKKRISSHSSDIVETMVSCPWRNMNIMLYSDRSISQPLTTLPNETLKVEALELFKSILLFTQVPIEPVAIDYHVCLLQNCLARFMKHTELRNEFFAQLTKQSTYILHRCFESKLSSSGSSGCSSIYQRSSYCSLSPSSSECQFITDPQVLESITQIEKRCELNSTVSQANSMKDKTDRSSTPEFSSPPSQTELVQVMQILAISVSLNLPRGRLRHWLIDHLKKFANASTNIGKYALFTLRTIDRTVTNGPRENVPSRTEIMSILLRNPYDHSMPHSLPINFADGSYLVIGADGSTTVEEFMASMSKSIDIRSSPSSDFYIFAEDPSDANTLHILEPQRKVLDVVGWWEQAFKQNNSGRYQNTRAIKLICKKRLVLRAEEAETDQERLLIVHQSNQEIVSRKMPPNEVLTLELAAIVMQITFGDYERSRDPKIARLVHDRIANFMTQDKIPAISEAEFTNQLMDHWQRLARRSTQSCVRVYLNCIRKLKLDEN